MPHRAMSLYTIANTLFINCNAMQGCATVACLGADTCVQTKGTVTAQQPVMALLGSQTADLMINFERAGVTLAQQVCV